MAKRRTKLEMQWMKEDVTEYLMRTNNNAHAAWDLFIKEHLEAGHCLPHYIKGNKDFVKVAEGLEAEIEAKQAEKEHKQQVKANKEMIINTLHTMSAEEFKAVYKQYKDIVSHNDKLNLVVILDMIMNNDFRGFDESLLNTIVRNNIELLPVEVVEVETVQEAEVIEEVAASVETVEALQEQQYNNVDESSKDEFKQPVSRFKRNIESMPIMNKQEIRERFEYWASQADIYHDELETERSYTVPESKLKDIIDKYSKACEQVEKYQNML